MTDFLNITPRDLININKGHIDKDRAEWEKVRMICYYSAGPYQPKGFKPSDVWTPYDEQIKVKRTKPSTRKALSREELKAHYNRSGLEISEKKLDQIYGHRI